MLNQYQTYIVKYKIKKGCLDSVITWSQTLKNNKLEVLQSLNNEDVVFELSFLEDGFLYYIFKALDIPRVFKVFGQSNLSVDQFHSSQMKQNLEPNSQKIIPLIDFEGNINKFEQKPLAISFGFQNLDCMEFTTTNGSVKIKNYNLSILTDFLKNYNGLNSLNKIAQLTKIDLVETLKLYEKLEELKIIVDSCLIYKWFDDMTRSDSPFKKYLSPEEILELKHPLTLESTSANNDLLPDLNKRDSVRYFNGKTHNLDQILGIIKATYFSGNFWIPSGGSIYPLKIMVIKHNAKNSVVYEFNPYKQELVEINSISNELFYNAFNDQDKLSKSSFCVIIFVLLYVQILPNQPTNIPTKPID